MKPARAVAVRAAACLLAAGIGSAAGAASPAIVVDGAWSRPAAATAAVYMTLHNRSAVADRLTGATSPWAGRVGLHQTSSGSIGGAAMSMGTMPRDGAMTAMKPVASITVPAHGTVVFEPGGAHLMLELRRPVKAGDAIPLRLRFARAGWIAAMATVRPVR